VSTLSRKLRVCYADTLEGLWRLASWTRPSADAPDTPFLPTLTPCACARPPFCSPTKPCNAVQAAEKPSYELLLSLVPRLLRAASARQPLREQGLSALRTNHNFAEAISSQPSLSGFHPQ